MFEYCVCVCVREREREQDSERVMEYPCLNSASKVQIDYTSNDSLSEWPTRSVAGSVCVCVCVVYV